MFTTKEILERVHPFWKSLFPIKTQPHYDLLPNDAVTTDLAPFIPVVITVLSICLILNLLFARKRSWLDKIAFFYLTLSCIIHFTIELYWARHNDKIFTDEGIIAHLWREFGKCDTRWHSQDEVIFALEFMAGYFCGPMALITIIGFILDRPWRHITQPICVTAQAYGLIITWVPAYFSGLIHVPVNNKIMYYGYFWLVQSPWLIFPIILCCQSIHYINTMYKKAQKHNKTD